MQDCLKSQRNHFKVTWITLLLPAVISLVLPKPAPALFGGMKMAKVLFKGLSDFLPVLLVFRLMDAELQKFVMSCDKEQGG